MKKFFWEHYHQEEANVIVFGVPLGKFSTEALQILRETSEFLEVFDIERKVNLLENVRIADVGDLEFKSLEEIKEQTKKIVENKKIPLILGGNHLLSLYSIEAFDDVKVVIFDAHGDLKARYEDEKIKEMDYYPHGNFDVNTNDATWLRKLCEKSKRDIVLIGIRSCDEDELNFIEENNIKYFTSDSIRENLEGVKEMLRDFTKDSRVYISIDLDVFDPSIAPAVDHPEPDGLLFRDFKGLINSIDGRIAGMDICCLKPLKDNQITEFLAVKVIFEIFGLISKAGVA